MAAAEPSGVILPPGVRLARDVEAEEREVPTWWRRVREVVASPEYGAFLGTYFRGTKGRLG